MGAMPSRVLLLFCAALIVLSGCNKKEGSSATTATSSATPGAPAQLPPAVAPPAVTQASWAPDALEELLAPIALYPDQLLTQILAASINSQEVLDGGNWLLENQGLKGDALDAAAQKAGFGAAMRSLLQFPTVVDMLCQQIDWTRQVGSAFSSDQKSVLDAVQRLRLQAAQVGNLKSTPEQTVETKTENNQTIVEVKPADPQVVYVPQYNPQAVYTAPPPAQAAPATTTTTADDPNTVSTGTAVAAGVIGFGLGALIGSAMDDDDDDYCCYPNWGHSTVVVGARPFYPPAYAYRPAYGSGFRPAYGYNPPAGYRNNYRQGNTTNINVDNSDYFNRFEGNRNIRAGTTRSPLGAGQNRYAGAGQNRYAGAGQNRSAQGGAQRANDWKGQSTYRGARDEATAQRLNQAAGGRAGRDTASTGSDRLRVADASSGRGSFSDERVARATQAERNRSSADRASHTDRGYGEAPRVQQRDAPVQRQQTAPAAPERSRDSAFGGAQARDSGSFERSASARGRASAGGRSERGGRGGGRHR